MSKMSIEIFGYDAELISHTEDGGEGLILTFASELDGYVSLANVTVRIKGASCAIDTRRIPDGEYTPHLILKDCTLNLPDIKIQYGVISPIEPDISYLRKLSIRERRLSERVESLEKKLEEINKKVVGSSLFSALP